MLDAQSVLSVEPPHPLHVIEMPAPIPPRRQIFLRALRLIGGAFGAFFLVILFIQSFVLAPARVNGRSMEPTHLDEELLFVNKILYLVRTPKRSDAIQMIDQDSTKLILKRVIGLPGETIFVKAGKVLVQTGQGTPQELNEHAYLSSAIATYVKGATSTRSWVLQKNEYFVLGDNRDHSTDSRTYGAVSRSRIIGKVISFEKMFRKK